MLVKDVMTKEVHTVEVPGSRSTVLKTLVKHNISGVPIVKKGNKKLTGIITRSNIIKNPGEDQIAMLMTRELITAQPDEKIETVIVKMIENDIRRLPIVENGNLVGIVTSSDILSNVLWKIKNDDPVEKYMIRSVPSAWEETPLVIAFFIMESFGFKSMLLLSGEGKVTGIITETDFIKESRLVEEKVVHNSSVSTEGDKWSWNSQSVLYVIKNKLNFSEKTLKDVANKNVISVTRKTTVEECATKMKQNNIEQVPVVNMENEPIGILRSSDLMQAALEKDDFE
ncbi:MAG: CBS domain-containing protein [Methanobacteriaceae archaeon]|nr:CBS domain-containing protein [Methanobacteriaceae archaeon]